ncbi:hypothetical protein V5O48_004063 [Marasmius crinis-equi]|uniref:Uncharacterized protein n=1 Tax=Marasmius crinis-equi TaxID=585013 RepID=A0ABR3FR57_9AGAR
MIIQGLLSLWVKSDSRHKAKRKPNTHFSQEDVEQEDMTILHAQEFSAVNTKAAARPIARCTKYFLWNTDAYTPIDEVIKLGLIAEGKMDIDSIDTMYVSFSSPVPVHNCFRDCNEQRLQVELFKELVEHTPQLRQLLNNLYENDDNVSLHFVCDRIPKHPKDQLKPQLEASAPKHDQRSINHPVIATLLAPRNLHKYISHSPNSRQRRGVIQAIQKGKVPLLTNSLQWFLYSEYDPKNSMNGLFKNHILFHVGRHIYTTPLSALNCSWRKSNKGNDCALGIYQTSSAMITYVVLQVRFALSAVDWWTKQDNEFNFIDFYYFIKDIIDGTYLDDPAFMEQMEEAVKPLEFSEDTTPEEQEEVKRKYFKRMFKAEKKQHDQWKTDLFKTWNLQLFGNKQGRDLPCQRKVPRGEHDKELKEARLRLVDRACSPDATDSGSQADYKKSSSESKSKSGSSSSSGSDSSDPDSELHEPPRKRAKTNDGSAADPAGQGSR